MQLSSWGTRMARASGLRAIMEDIATTVGDASGTEWLNLSIGNPAPIPAVAAMWRDCTAQALAEDFGASCSYGASRGSAALLEAIAAHFNAAYGWDIGPQHVVVGPGSQMLCFLAAAMFAGQAAGGPRRIVLPVAPDYTGYHGLAMAAGGLTAVAPKLRLTAPSRFRYDLDPEALAAQDDVGLLLISSPANPTGRAASRAELDAILAFARSRDVPVLVDNAYGEPFPRVATSLCPPIFDRHVINCFSISKAGLPGERIGFAIAAPEIAGAMTSFLSTAALHAPQLAQATLRRALASGALQRLADTAIRPHYRAKRRFAEALFADRFPAGLTWRLHDGAGMFCWLWIDEPDFDDTRFYTTLKRRGVFLVPGRHFFSDLTALDGHCTRCIRLSLSADERTIAEGVARIAAALGEMRRAAVA